MTCSHCRTTCTSDSPATSPSAYRKPVLPTDPVDIDLEYQLVPIGCPLTICGRNDGTLRNNYYHGCTVNGTAVTSGKGCEGADITANNGALPAYRLALGENITTPPGTFLGQTEWLDPPPVGARLAHENGFTLAGNHYFASGYKFTPGSTLASGAAQGYTPRATLGGELLDPYTPTGDADPLDGVPTAKGLYIHGGKKVVVK